MEVLLQHFGAADKKSYLMMASWLLAETHWKFSVCRGKPHWKKIEINGGKFYG